jgi:hypothetical protein
MFNIATGVNIPDEKRFPQLGTSERFTAANDKTLTKMSYFTSVTGMRARCSTLLATEPSSKSFNGPIPRVPITMD